MTNALKITGDADLIAKLNGMETKLARRAVRKAVSAATTIMVKGIKSEVKDDKSLRKSIGRRKRTYRNSGVVTEIVGPRFEFEDDGKTPSKYAAAVEYGTEGQAPQPFMRRGFANSVAAAQQAMTQKLAEGVAQEAKA